MPVSGTLVSETRQACAELRSRLRAGERVRVEEILKERPDLARDENAILELILEEISTRQLLGQPLLLREWQERFPLLLPCVERRLRAAGIMSSELTTLSDSSPWTNGPPPGSRTQGALPKIGNYQILEELGRGGMGVVYKAKQPSLSRLVAIKMILAGEHAGVRERARLRTEAEAAAQLIHPNVVQIYEIGEHEGLPYVAMEYIGGGSLGRMLRGTPQPYRWSARLTETLARTIHVAHLRGIVHRDLSPSNILMTMDGTAKITDFGLAKFLFDEESSSLSGAIVGTPSYMAPEQVSNQGKPVGPGVDIYALGALLYEMVTGVAPFRGLTPMETLCQVVEGEVVPPSKLRRGVPFDLETICLKCLDRDPARRYATAEELADDLKRFQEQRPIRAHRASRFRRALQWARRKPVIAGLVTVSVVLFFSLIGVIASYSLYLRETNRQLERDIAHEARLNRVISIQRDRLKREQHLARRHWYAAQLNLISHSLDSVQSDVGLELLEAMRGNLAAEDSLGFEWHYLDRLSHRQGWLLDGHRATVSCLEISRDGRTLVSGDEEGYLMIWDILSRRPAVSMTERHWQPIQNLALWCDASGKAVLIASLSESNGENMELKLWNAASGQLLHSYRIDLSTASDLAFSQDGRILAITGISLVHEGAEALSLHVDPTRGQVAWEERRMGVVRQEFSPDGRWHAVGLEDGRVSLIDGSSQTEVPLECPDTAPIVTMAFSSKGDRLAVGRQNGSVTIWDPNQRTILGHFADVETPPRLLAFAKGGAVLLICEGNDTLVAREVRQGGTRRVCPELGGEIRSMSVSPDGETVALGGHNLPPTLLEVDTFLKRNSFPANRRETQDIRFSPDGTMVFVSCETPQVRIWSLVPKPDNRLALTGHEGGTNALAFTPDSSLLVSVGKDSLVKIWDPGSGRELASLAGHAAEITCVASFADAQRFVTAGLDGTVRVWDWKRGTDDPERIAVTSSEIGRFDEPLYGLAIAPDGESLAVAGGTGVLHILGLSQPGHHWSRRGHDKPILWLSYSPCQSYLASASSDRAVGIWSAKDLAFVDLKRFSGIMRTGAFAPNSLYLAVGGETSSVTLLSTTSADNRILPGHPRTVRCIAFSPDSRIVATGADDRRVRLWDLSTGLLYYALRGHSAPIQGLAFSRSGSILASCDQNGIIRLWHADEPKHTEPERPEGTGAFLPASPMKTPEVEDQTPTRDAG
jgi:WD40 repeat protein/tRNA A-37 threonylcarbamoyl transferase component Bud32